MSILALILIIDAGILASMDGPDLPDAFKRPETAAVVEPEALPNTVTPAAEPTPRPEVNWETSTASSGVSRSMARVPERWLVSEPWCSLCPAAKARFLASGGNPDNVITIAKAKELHGRIVKGVPHEYTTTVEREVLNPDQYRYADEMAVELEHKKRPSKEAILRHLRTGGPHQNKHWQAWHLESWDVKQLYALHDDDHLDRVPTYNETTVSATLTNAEASPEVVAAILAQHLLRESDIPEKPAFAGLFEIDVDAPDSARKWAADLLRNQSVEFPSVGVSASWKGSDRQISVAPGRLQIKPGATVSVKKFGVSLSTTLRGVSFADDLSWATLELDGAPDLTVRFQ